MANARLMIVFHQSDRIRAAEKSFIQFVYVLEGEREASVCEKGTYVLKNRKF